jgi:hypothetical protein
MELESRRTRRVIAVIGFVWIVTFMFVYLVARGGPTLWRIAVVVYGGFGLLMMGALWFGKDERAVLRRAHHRRVHRRAIVGCAGLAPSSPPG